MTRLRSCEACSRHVFVTETRCPFCSAELEPVSNAPIFNIKPGMSRAQRFTLVAAVASQTLLGCSDDPKTGLGSGSQQGSGGSGGSTSNAGSGGGGAGSGGSSGGGVAMPVYGAPFNPGQGSGGASTGSGGSSGGGAGVQAVYGAPVPVDAGVSDDAGAGDAGPANDGGPKLDAGRIQPVYGAPLPPYGLPPLPDK